MHIILFKLPRLNIKILLILLLLTVAIVYYFYPKSPHEMTVIDQQQQSYFAVCPALINAHNKESKTTLNNTFTLLSWNIYKQQKTTWLTQLNKWAAQADFITLQEAKGEQALTNFNLAKHFTSLMNIAFTYQQENYGVNTLSHIKPQQVCGTRYKEPLSQIAKSGLASTYPIQDSLQTLLLINLHGVNFTLTATPLMEQLLPYLHLIMNHDGPIIMTGDFNTWSEARTKVVNQALTGMGLSEVVFKQDNRLHVFGRPLDHVFYRDLQVDKAQSIKTTASDHNPLLVTFSTTKSTLMTEN